MFVPYQGGIEKGGYFQVIFEGEEHSAVQKTRERFQSQRKKATSSITKTLPAVFKDKPVFYLVTKKVVRFIKCLSLKAKKLKVFGEKQNTNEGLYKDKTALDLKQRERFA